MLDSKGEEQVGATWPYLALSTDLASCFGKNGFLGGEFGVTAQPDDRYVLGRKTLSGTICSQLGSTFTARSAISTNSGGKRCSD